MSLQATVVKDILYAAATYGAAYDTLREMAGFEDYEISDSNLTVEWQKAVYLWDMLADVNNDEQIGLILGQEVGTGMLGMVGFMIQSCKTLEEAFETYCEFGYMVCPMVIMKYRKENGRAYIEFHQNDMWKNTYPRNARIGIDFSISGCVNFTRALSGRNINPLAIEMEHSRCGQEMYEKLLGGKAVFNAPLYRLVFREEDMMHPVKGSDQSLYETFKSILSQRKTLFMQCSTTNALKNLLFMQFKGQIPTIEEAASSLNMTVRTLQRKLVDESTSYRTIANEVKKDLSLRLMQTANATEVAEILGYSDLPSFRRAFKTWTKTTPKEVKRMLSEEQLVTA